MFDESGQQIVTMAKFIELIGEPLPQVFRVDRSEVAQTGILRVTPDALVRVEAWGVGWQLFVMILRCVRKNSRTTLARSCTRRATSACV